VFAALKAQCQAEHQVGKVDNRAFVKWLEDRGVSGVGKFARETAPNLFG